MAVGGAEAAGSLHSFYQAHKEEVTLESWAKSLTGRAAPAIFSMLRPTLTLTFNCLVLCSLAIAVRRWSLLS